MKLVHRFYCQLLFDGTWSVTFFKQDGHPVTTVLITDKIREALDTIEEWRQNNEVQLTLREKSSPTIFNSPREELSYK
jgi:hypothetical protein